MTNTYLTFKKNKLITGSTFLILLISCNENKLVDHKYLEYVKMETEMLQGETNYFLSKSKKYAQENPPKYRLYYQKLKTIESGMQELIQAADSNTMQAPHNAFDFESFTFMPTVRNHLKTFQEGVKLLDEPLDKDEQIILYNNIEKFRNAIISNFYLKYFMDDSFLRLTKLQVNKLPSNSAEFFQYALIGFDTTRQDKISVEQKSEQIEVINGVANIPSEYQGKKATYYYIKEKGAKIEFPFVIGK